MTALQRLTANQRILAYYFPYFVNIIMTNPAKILIILSKSWWPFYRSDCCDCTALVLLDICKWPFYRCRIIAILMPSNSYHFQIMVTVIHRFWLTWVLVNKLFMLPNLEMTVLHKQSLNYVLLYATLCCPTPVRLIKIPASSRCRIHNSSRRHQIIDIPDHFQTSLAAPIPLSGTIRYLHMA